MRPPSTALAVLAALGGGACLAAPLGCSNQVVEATAGATGGQSLDAGSPPDGGSPHDAGVSPSLITLASKQVRPTTLALDATRVYWGSWNANRVMACSKDGCNDAPTTLASSTAATALAVNAHGVYWIDQDGALSTCPLGGCPGKPTKIGAGGVCNFGDVWCWNLAADAENLYFTTDNAVVQCPSGGPCDAPAQLVTLVSSTSVAVDATSVYWIGLDVMKCAIGGCGGNPTTLASGQSPLAIAVGGDNVYWIDAEQFTASVGSIKMCAASGCGGNPKTLATGQRWPKGIAADATGVYWTTNASDANLQPNTGAVLKCAASGCGGTPTVLAAAQDFPLAIAVDATSVYWTNDGGDTIMKLTPK